MTVAYWLENAVARITDGDAVPPLGARVRVNMPNNAGVAGYFVVSEIWLDERHEWHAVLRYPDTPAESTPPWERVKSKA